MRIWKIAMLIPIIILLISIGILFNNYYETGEFVKRGIEFTGGKLITLQVTNKIDVSDIQTLLPGTNIRLTKTNNLLVETSFEADENEIIKTIEEHATIIGEPSIRTVGPALGKVFWSQTQTALITAFVLMAIIVFFLFKTIIPSTAVILAALTDIIVTLTVINSFGIKLSLATLAGLLMLIGYSVDTDILLTSRMLKIRTAEIRERIRSSMKTGLTTQTTTIVAAICLYHVINNIIIQQIALVLMIGLVIDILSTWLTNAGILRWYTERKERIIKGYSHEHEIKTEQRKSKRGIRILHKLRIIKEEGEKEKSG